MEKVEMKTQQTHEPKLGRAQAMRRALVDGSERGMSLVEVLIVLAIMASIAGVVGFFAVGALEEAQIREAAIEVGQLDNGIQQYMVTSSPPQLPNSLDDLTKGRNPIIKNSVPQDPWGNDYVYRKSSNRDYEIFSMGPDGQEGTEDDITTEQ